MKKRAKKVTKKASPKDAGAKIGIRPLADRVLIKEEKKDEMKQTDAGILVPEGSEKEGGGSRRGEVVAVGPGRFGDDNELLPMTLKRGDKVIFQWGEKVKLDGVDYFVAREGDIIAVLGN